MDQEYYRKLISGQIGGSASSVRLLLPILSFFYGVVIRLRNILYNIGLLRTHRLDRPVISVGNITAGGTGKTPLVIWLCRCLSGKKKTVILTRGYKAQTSKEKTSQTYVDEPQILIKKCQGVEIIINADRVEGAREAIRKFNAEVLVLDDGFQHRRLGRDVDIVTVDATKPFGYGRLLPAGLLREPPCSLIRADAVVITRCDHVNEIQLKMIEKQIENNMKDAIVTKTAHKVVAARLANGKKIIPEALKGKRIFAFCGIGNPHSFITTLRDLGCEIAGSKIYNDHYHYREEDINEIINHSDKTDADLIITTEKDWTKLDCIEVIQSKRTSTIGCLVVELKFIDGEEKIRGLI
ncbi:MAG: tetraacyldisaccharide 4'-kinase, partial [Planctomycetota bacterium]